MDEEGVETEIDELHFFYDAQSRPAFVEYNSVKYRYIHNLQGNIVGILDNSGALVVEYKYDVWGTPLSASGTLKTSLGKLHPFRYRGYVFDAETELYYLRSRYYNAVCGRFISRDSILVKNIVLQSNLWSYCANKPITYLDPSGMKFYLIGDEQGYEILNHWLEGSGEELICDSDAWGKYMREQKGANEIVLERIVDAYKECMNSENGRYEETVWKRQSVELSNGYSPYGSNYLHGTKYFYTKVSATLDKKNNTFGFSVECRWEDTIDPNNNYRWDGPAASFFEMIGNPKDYTIKIEWTCDTFNFWDQFKAYLDDGKVSGKVGGLFRRR